MIKLIRNNKINQTKKIITLLLILFFTILNPNLLESNKTNALGLSISTPTIEIALSKDSLNSIKYQLQNELNIYINKHAPNSKISSKKIIELCKQNNFDLVLAMSQAHIETHYGTKGMATKTNSVFNVGTYDDGTIKYRYKDPNNSIEPYIILMNNNYLQNKTTIDILKPRSFVDYKGDRYASLKQYEYRVKGIYDNIIKNTCINDLYEIYISDHYNKSIQLHKSLTILYSKKINI